METLAGQKARVVHMPTPGALASFGRGKSLKTTRDEWAGSTMEEAQERAKSGDMTRVGPSDALLDRIESTVDLDGLRRVSLPSVAGGAPNIPAFLAGQPMAMRCRRSVKDDKGEVFVMANVFASASVSHHTMQIRGAAVLALVRALSMIRPVRLTAFIHHERFNGAETFVACDIDTAPLDLARAAWVLTAPESYRRLFLSANYAAIGEANASSTYSKTDLRAAEEFARSMGADSVLVTPTLVSFDGSAPFASAESAVTWVQSQLALYA